METKRSYIFYNGRDAEVTPGSDVLTIARQWDINPFKAVDVLTEKGIPILYGYTCTNEAWRKFKRGEIV